MKHARAAWIWLLLLLAAGSALAQPATIPAKAFFQSSEFSSVTISPDGKYLAVVGLIKDKQHKMQIDIVDIANMSVYAKYYLRQGIPSQIWWVNNTHLLFTTAFRLGWFDPPVSNGIVWLVNINSSHLHAIAQHANVYQVLHRDNGKKGYVKIYFGKFMEFDEDKTWESFSSNDLKYLGPCIKMPKPTGSASKKMNITKDGSTYSDNTGRERFWFGYNNLTYAPEMAYSPPCGSDMNWYDISSFISKEPRYEAYGPWMFTKNNKKFYYVGMTKAGTVGLYLVDPDTWKKTLLYDDPVYDIETSIDSEATVLKSADGNELLAFEYMADRPVWILVNRSALQVKLLEQMEQTFAGEYVEITSSSMDGRLSVIMVSSDRNPGEYFLYDAQTKKLEKLFDVMPGIDPNQMAPMQPIQFKARDGTTIHGYLTRPLGKTKNLPLIVLPHGGPFGIRDDWGFDPEVQFFAYHGYAVLQIEYRGSGGYGYAFQKAGYRQWGGIMQDDLTDGTRWAIQQGIADPNRICIYGGSYGGYAAIEGVVKEPDLYKCAVGYAGVYDLVSFHNRFHTLHYESYIPYISSDLGNNLAYLKAHSPVFHVNKIKAALFLAHGGMDHTVPIDQADELRDALDKIHKPYEWVYYRSEAHGFAKAAHRVALYTKMLAFFDKYIGNPTSVGAKKPDASAAPH